MKTVPALLLGFLISTPFARASQPTLQSVLQPLWYHLTAADQLIQFMEVPKIFTGADRDQALPLIHSPTRVSEGGPDLNLISRYGLQLSGTSQPPHGIVPKITIDATKASQPENYPFTVEEVVLAAVKCIRDMFPNSAETEIWVTDAQGSRKIESPGN